MESVAKERLTIQWEYELLLQASAFMAEFKVHLDNAYELNKEHNLPVLPSESIPLILSVSVLSVLHRDQIQRQWCLLGTIYHVSSGLPWCDLVPRN